MGLPACLPRACLRAQFFPSRFVLCACAFLLRWHDPSGFRILLRTHPMGSPRRGNEGSKKGGRRRMGVGVGVGETRAR